MRGADARLLAEQAFPSAFRQRAWNAKAQDSDTTVERYVSDHAAIVRDDDGQRALRLGTLPLQVQGDPLDTALVKRGSAFVQKNGVVDVQVAELLRDGLTFPAVDVSVRPETEKAGGVTGRALGATVTWTEIAQDTDFSFSPTPTGVQTLHQLRSASSPESLGFIVDLPDGSRLVTTDAGGLAMQGRGGELVRLSAPVAVDAAGASVDVRAELTARGFRLVVPHRSADVTYPLLVDPTYQVEQRYWRDGSAMYIRGWRSVQQTNAFPFHHYDHLPNSPRGLTVESRPNTNYDSGAWGGYRFDAPGQTMLSYVELPQQIFQDFGGSFCVEQGLFNAHGWQGAWVHPASGQSAAAPWGGHCAGNYWSHTMAYQTSSPTTGSAFLSRIYANGSRYRSGDFSHLHLPGALVHLVDNTPPSSLSISGITLGGWTKEQPQTVTLGAADNGIGMHHIALEDVQTAAKVAETTTGCNTSTIASAYQPRHYCPWSYSDSPTFTNKEGARQLRIQATNAFGPAWPIVSADNALVRSTHNVVACQDWTPPSVAMTGSLVNSQWKVPRGESRTLTVTAGGESGRSGVRLLEMKLGSAHLTPALSYPTPNPCSTTNTGIGQRQISATVNTTNLAYGPHTINVTANDSVAGNDPAAGTLAAAERVKTFTVTDVTKPTVQVGGSATLPYAPGGNELDIVASDGPQGSGVRRVSVQVGDAEPQVYDRGGCSTYQCPSADWQFTHTVDPELVADGAHEVKVTAYDAFNVPSIVTRTTIYKVDLTLLLHLDQVHDDMRWSSPLLASGWANANPDRWVDSYRGGYRATALGLGLQTLKLKEPLSGGDGERDQSVLSPLTDEPCDGTIGSPCPLLLPSLTGTADNDVAYDTSGWREGVVRPSMRVKDQTGGQSDPYPGTIRDPRVEMAVDHTPPVITTSGSLAPFEGGVVTERRDAANPLVLEVLAQDGAAGEDQSLWRSGVKSTQISIAKNIGYGQPESAWTWAHHEPSGDENAACSDQLPQRQFANCEQRRSLQLTTDELGEGLHVIRITSKDRLALRDPDEREHGRPEDHVATKDFVFYVDLNDPTVDAATVHHGQPIDGWFNEQTLTVAAAAADQGTGVAQGVVTYPVRDGRVGPAKAASPVFGAPDPCHVSARPADRCPQTIAAAAVSYEAANIAEGAAVSINFSVLDGIDRGSAAGPQWTLRVDHTPPAWSNGLGASGGASTTGYGSLVWEPAADPQLTDGAEGSGTAGYTVRYTRNGGPVTEVEANVPEVALTGAQSGEQIHLEVQARDWAGVTSPPVSADFALGEFDGCDPAVPATCESDDSLMIEDEEDPPVMAQMVEDPSSRVAYPAKRYRLVTAKENCRTRVCWATIRSYAHSWAVGNTRIVHTESSAAEVPRATITRTDVVEDNEGYEWFLGNLSWIGGGCGWVRVDPPYEGPIEDASSECPPEKNWRWWDWTFPSDKKSRGNNCFERRSTPHPETKRYWTALPINRCTQGTAIKLLRGTVVCANVGLLPDGRTTGCAKHDVIDRISNTESLDYCVNWRYITRDGQWVMVRHDDRVRANEHGGWSFIRRDALPEDRMEWVGRFDRPTCKNWDGRN